MLLAARKWGTVKDAYPRTPRFQTLTKIVSLLLSAMLTTCGHKASLPQFVTLPQQPPIQDQGIIKHVIVIVQENRSFDNLFNGFPGADTVPNGNANGVSVPLTVTPFEDKGLDVGHSHLNFESAYDNGKMDNFNGEGTYAIIAGQYLPIPGPHNYAYSRLPQSETAPYWDLASQFTVADRMFTSNSGPSFPAHQYLIAGQSNNATEVPSGLLWGCDAAPGSLVPQLQPDGSENKGVFPCFDYPTLADELDQAGITWRYYAPAMNAPGYIFSAYDAVRHVRFGTDWTTNVVSPETTVLTDIASGTLPQVSWVIPSLPNSDHALAASNTGPQWVASIVDAVGTSQYWNDAAIVIMWDDWGGWYDHVPPPALDVMGLGFRVPLIVVSPYAKHGYVSHITHEAASIPHFIEATYGLATLSAADARADELTDCFDFTQSVKALQPVKTLLGPQDFVRRPHVNGPNDPD
jgi:phospholipase C